MAYFRSNESYPEEEYTEDAYPEEEETEEAYDDGFDELQEEESVTELSPEERAERTFSRVRLFMGAGNLFGVIAGTVLILVMVTLIISIIHFVITDMGRSFSLFQTNF